MEAYSPSMARFGSIPISPISGCFFLVVSEGFAPPVSLPAKRAWGPWGPTETSMASTVKKRSHGSHIFFGHLSHFSGKNSETTTGFRWIGLRENLQESPILSIFNGKITLVSCNFSLKPIQSNRFRMVSGRPKMVAQKTTPFYGAECNLWDQICGWIIFNMDGIWWDCIPSFAKAKTRNPIAICRNLRLGAPACS